MMNKKVMKIEKAINKFDFIIEKTPILLSEISEESMSIKINSTKWSKKEILGHLIDSATNNHHRFIRGQFENNPEISYDQNKWNECSFYQEIDSQQIINFWTMYNKQLLEIIKRMPTEKLKNQIRIVDDLVTLEFLIVDYVEHLEYHLKQIIEH